MKKGISTQIRAVADFSGSTWYFLSHHELILANAHEYFTYRAN